MTDLVELTPSEYVAALTLLKQIDFLQDLPEEKLKGMLFSINKQSFTSNRTIIFQGEISNQLFILRRGKVVITTKNKGSQLQLAELMPPMYFGEISLLTPTSATATVKAGEEGVDLLIITHDALAQLSKKTPDIRQRIQKVIDSRIQQKKEAKEAEESN